MAERKTKQKSSAVKDQLSDIIKQEAEKLGDSYQPDPEFDSERDINHGPTFFKEAIKDRDERVIDQLLASAPQSKGYYLKLYREVGPGQYEYKMRIDEYENWSDLEHEVAKIVIYMTKRAPAKWGSGSYKVVIWNDKGVRGENYPAFIFAIDAMDPEKLDINGITPQPDPHAMMGEQINMFANMANAMKGLTPPPINPADTNKQLADSFSLGMNAAGNNSNNNSQQMTMMMTMMMGMMKEFATALRPPDNITPPVVTSPTDELAKTLAMMKAMGVLPDSSHKNDMVSTLKDLGTLGFQPFKTQDPLEQVSQMKSIFGMFKDLMGTVEGEAGERPGLAEKLVDVLGPQIGQILGNITQISTNYTNLRTNPKTIPDTEVSVPLDISRPASIPSDYYPEREHVMGSVGGGFNQPQPAPVQQAPEPVQQKSENDMFLDELYVNMMSDNKAFYEKFHTMIQSIPQGNDLLAGIAEGTVTVENIIGMLHSWGKARFSAPDIQGNLHNYMVGFLAWLQEKTQREQPTYTPTAHVYGKCQLCGEEYVFDHESDVQQANICEEKIKNGETIELCGGTIEILQGQA